MFQASRALFLYCTSPVHMGAGAAIGTIDNPVQRERHTGHPMLAGSGLKGAFRHHLQSDGWDQALGDGHLSPLLERVFGPEAGGDRLHAGALSLADAQIVLFPVRSLRHSFVYLTCPTALGRLLRLLEFTDGEKPDWHLDPLEKLARDQCASHNQELHEEGVPAVVLESFAFEVNTHLSELCSQVAAWLAERALDPRPSLTYFRKKLAGDLVIVHDDRFSYFVRAATIVEPHVRIDDATGTASDGGLFYTENVPPESLFLSVTMATRERRPTPKPTSPPSPDGPAGDTERASKPAANGTASPLDADRIIDLLIGGEKDLHGLQDQLVQIGGDATTGRGQVLLRFLGPPDQLDPEAADEPREDR